MGPDETGWIRPHLDAPRRTRGKESKNKIEYKMRGIWDAQSVCHPAFLLYIFLYFVIGSSLIVYTGHGGQTILFSEKLSVCCNQNDGC